MTSRLLKNLAIGASRMSKSANCFQAAHPQVTVEARHRLSKSAQVTSDMLRRMRFSMEVEDVAQRILLESG